MGDGVIERGGSGTLQSRGAGGRYGDKAGTPDPGTVEIRDEKQVTEVERSKLPTQANRTTRGPEVVG